MPTRRVTRVSVVVLLSATVLGLSAGSVSASPGQVPKSVVQSQAAKVLAAETGQPLPTVTCPSGLTATVGTSIRCTLIPKGSTARYPVKVTVNSVKGGTAHFEVSVGQAIGAGNKTEFCHDNAVLDQVTAVAKKPSDLIAIFKDNESTISDFQATAPSSIASAAGTLALAAGNAIRSDNANAFTTAKLIKASAQVNAFCGQNADGSPVS
jgi:hypothetical protein